MSKPLLLYLTNSDSSHIITASRPDGSAIVLPGLRLVTYANFLRALKPSPGAGAYGICRCLIDTGSYLSIIPQEIWERFRPGIVTPLTFGPMMHPSLRSITIAGGTYPYTLGELSIQLEDHRRSLLNVTVIAKLTQDGGQLPIPLTLGLRGGFLDGRKLSAEPDPNTPFGQKWTVEEP